MMDNTEQKTFPEMVDSDPWEYVRVALAIETIAYHNRNYFDYTLYSNKSRSQEIQALLTEALKKADKL